MKCFRCSKTIDKKSHYYAMTEFSRGNKVKTDYVHKECWDKFLGQLDGASQSLKKSNFLLDIMANQMNKMGMIPKKEDVVYV